MQKKVLVVGIGSPHGHDRLGWSVALSLKQCQSDKCDVRIAMTPADLLDWLEGYDTLHLCDACQSHSSVDSPQSAALHRWQWPDEHIQEQQWSGSHDLGLSNVLRLATQLGTAPSSIILWGLEATSVGTSDQLVQEAVKRISSELTSE